jgi:predicted metalloprotease
MRLDDFRASENVDDRRSGGGFSGGGRIGIVGVVLALVVSYFTGINPLTLINGYEQIAGPGPQTQQSARHGAPDDQTGQFVAKVLGATEDTWTDIFQQQGGRAYSAPQIVLFRGATQSACGTAQTAMGPFYCPNDRTIYLDTAFFEEMRARYNACPAEEGACAFSQAYVIAHEVGHHVQNLIGTLPRVQRARQEAQSEAQANALSVRLELQADCLAGVWAQHTEQKLRFIQAGDVEAALQTASAIGDDRLQRRSQGRVAPDSFTHGSAAQRQQWFTTGLKSGQVQSCDTFRERS